jgi:TRAP-type C4-dicarboxylate transport system substrate-binding protein
VTLTSEMAVRRRNFIKSTLAISLMLMAAPAFAQIKWTLPSAYSADNFHSQNLEAFATDLAEATGGKLSIKVYPDASLLPLSVIKSAVRMGRMEIGETLISLHDNEDPIFGIDVVPFLATSYDEARKLWEASKPLVERKLADQGLMPLFAVPWPPQGIFTSKEINEIADMKGLSWRVYNASTQRIAEIIGAYPITIQAAVLRQALSTGMIGALMTSAATGYDIKVWDRMSYFYCVYHFTKICDAAGIQNLRRHDLRHSFASTVISKGFGLADVGALLGHTRAQTTMRYAHLLPSRLREATEAAGKLLSVKRHPR